MPWMDEWRTRGNGWALGAVLIAGLVLLIGTIWFLPPETQRPSPGAQVADVQTPVGTAGVDAREADLPERSPGITTAPILRQLDELIGGDEFVGRRVEFELGPEEVSHHVAFWVGDERPRLLVVMARDTRDAAEQPPGGGRAIDDLSDAERVHITGVVERVPEAEATVSWGLTRPEYAELAERGVYVRADRVRAVTGS
jgi:hypothetical protein